MENTQGTVKAVCLSPRKGERKPPVDRARIKAGQGLEGDAHAGPGPRQISLLCAEEVDEVRAKYSLELTPGIFGENLLVQGIRVAQLPVGTTLSVGETATLRITKIGKECHAPCVIGRTTGDCLMPKRGVFAEVLTDGEVAPGDPVAVV